jgi:hypothetical protein
MPIQSGLNRRDLIGAMKPVDSKESARRDNFASPHGTFRNHDEALRIARRRWKRNRSIYLRRKSKKQIGNDTRDDYDQQT